jgi:hypothetical protein
MRSGVANRHCRRAEIHVGAGCVGTNAGGVFEKVGRTKGGGEVIKPETYWEDRARETENTLRRVCDILVKHANPYLMQDLFALRDAWQDVITKLDADWKEAERLKDSGEEAVDANSSLG